ncbi:MAG: hypothetical protein M1813_009536 [Trichoglossum hirsutum]|nr:MAG: hypothetical protein M1813_009536 [Trichoglossum hirsutum]
MSILKVLIPVLAAVGSTLAQDCRADSNTIQNQGDAKSLGSCSSISGDVIVAPVASGTISLDGIQSIGGSLICRDAVNLTSLSAQNLKTIGNTFELNGLTVLSTLNFAALTEVKEISWTALPALQQLTFTSKVKKATNVLITNTQLNSLDGINLEQADVFNVNNNQYLRSVNVQLANVTKALNVEANGKDLVASFPNLQWAFNITFRNCSDISLPSLASVNGSIGFFDNYLTSFNASNLTSTGPGGSVVFVSNSKLTSVSLPVLKTVGGALQMANNTVMTVVDGFPALSVVAGAVDFSGNFTNVSLPSLTDVRGGFNMQTSAKEFDCSGFKAYKSNGTIKGNQFECSGNQQNPGKVGSTPTGSSSPKKTGAAGRYEANVAAMVGASALIAGFWHLSL